MRRALFVAALAVRLATACASPLTVAELRDAGDPAEPPVMPFFDGPFEGSQDEPPDIQDPPEDAGSDG